MSDLHKKEANAWRRVACAGFHLDPAIEKMKRECGLSEIGIAKILREKARELCPPKEKVKTIKITNEMVDSLVEKYKKRDNSRGDSDV